MAIDGKIFASKDEYDLRIEKVSSMELPQEVA
jgi:hypothetical protein